MLPFEDRIRNDEFSIVKAHTYPLIQGETGP